MKNEAPAGLLVQGLRKQRMGFVLHADFKIQPAERAVIVARSGSGKTTLLRMIAGLEPHGRKDLGRILLNGRDITAMSPEKRRVGLVFQDSALFPALTVLENVVFGMRVQKICRQEREALARDWLKKVGLHDLADSSVARLSGGEKQRVAWIRAILAKPDALLLDEPFSALDGSLREMLRLELVRIHEECPVPLILVTHDAQDAESVSTTRINYRESADGSERCFEKI